MIKLMRRVFAFRFIAFLGTAIILQTSAASALQVTIDLGLDCIMPASTATLCGVPGAPTIPGGDPLWIDFTLNGAPMGHIVSDADTLWTFNFLFENVNPIPGFAPGLALTDMDGIIPGFENIPGTVNEFPPTTIYSYDSVLIPGGTFIHDLHLQEVCESCQFTGLDIFTTDPHVKGVWEAEIPEPATLLTFGVGLAGLSILGWRRRRAQTIAA